MTASLLRGDALHLPIADHTVDLVITSPPYFGLRSYQDGGQHYPGQIGSEATPAEWVEAMLAATAEMVRVLKPSGSIWVNLGDKYANPTGSGSAGRGNDPRFIHQIKSEPPQNSLGFGIRQKSLLGLPWRYALACIDQLGLILRAEVIWSKPNCLSGGTMLYAKVNGRPTTIRVHDLCRAYSPDQVQLWNGERWTQVIWWQPTDRHPSAVESYKAIRAARRRGDTPVIGGDIEIELRSGERVGCTRDHRWPTQRGLVNAAELVEGDVLDTCRVPEGDTSPAALDDEAVGWFVGLYIAEGSHSERTIQIAGHVKELARLKRLQELAAAFHGTCTVHATGGNAATINLTGRFLDAILETYVGGRTAKDKHLRPACWQRSNRFLQAVLDGYLSGDGHWREDAHRWIVGFTDNDALAADLRALGARLELSVRLTRCTHTGFGKEWPGWRGNITEPQRRRRPDSEILAIRQSRARQFWDIGVEDEPHIFALASGVLTHNSLPESVTDRVRRSHETWLHFTVQPRYFAAIDEIREPQAEAWRSGRAEKHVNQDHAHDAERGRDRLSTRASGREYSPLGKLPGSVWSIPSQPLSVPPELGVDHFAAFPMAWPRRLIGGWSPAGICTVCGEGRRPVTIEARTSAEPYRPPVDLDRRRGGHHGMGSSTLGPRGVAATITGYACGCPDTTAPTTPAVVLDGFGGTGTTALVAHVMGRHGITIDLSADYCRLATWRTTDPGQLAQAAQVDKPPVQTVGQDTLFGVTG
jgi:hypothetical protein